VLVRDLMLALQGSLLVRHAPANVSDAFCASRFGEEATSVFGLLPHGLDMRGIAERAGPAN
jgi:putative acyl-CoA dehydrogenase